MVDSNEELQQKIAEAERSSNSSMVDSNINPFLIIFFNQIVQIPLWSIVTHLFSFFDLLQEQFKFLYGR